MIEGRPEILSEMGDPGADLETDPGLVVQWRWIGTTWALHWYCDHTVPAQYSCCIAAIVVLRSYYSGVSLALHGRCIGSALMLPWY